MAVGINTYGRCKVSDWTDIVAIAAGSAHTLGMKADGTVLAIGDNILNQCSIPAELRAR